MNKPATKEPSMDEILSSIRQIIADDDAASASPEGADGADAAGPQAAESLVGAPEAEEPLALSADQILKPEEPLENSMEIQSAAELAAVVDVKAEFIDPDDIAFGPGRSEEESVSLRPQALQAVQPPAAPLVPSKPPVVPSRPTAAQAAPMPDPKLSADIAEELLEPTTNSAVRANFARLNNLGLGNGSLTIETMMREMLRPLLKEWLDEHLPAVVERMVEREIDRISRGID